VNEKGQTMSILHFPQSSQDIEDIKKELKRHQIGLYSSLLPGLCQKRSDSLQSWRLKFFLKLL